MELSVVVPTHNRGPILARCLECLAAQTLVDRPWEVVVVDDGSHDDTPARIAGLSDRLPFPLVYMRQPNRGPAAARNAGIRAARGRLQLFIGDDILAGPG